MKKVVKTIIYLFSDCCPEKTRKPYYFLLSFFVLSVLLITGGLGWNPSYKAPDSQPTIFCLRLGEFMLLVNAFVFIIKARRERIPKKFVF